MKTAVVLLAIVAVALGTLPFKNVQGPPEEFEMHKLPTPKSAADSSDSAMFPIFLRKDSANSEESWTGDLPVDSESLFTLTFVSNIAKDLQLEVLAVKDLHGNVIGAKDLPVPTEVHNSWFGFNVDSSTPSKTFEYKAPVRGVWTVKIHTTSATESTKNPQLYLIAYNESPDRVTSYLGSYMTHTNEKFSVVASMVHTDANGVKTLGRSDMGSPLIADLDITTPSGEIFVLQMHDDGENNDGAANDGVYGASFSATASGSYTAQVVMKGQIGKVEFVRTSQHLVAVVDKRVELTSSGAKLNIDMNDEMAEVEIPATIVGDASAVVGQKFKAYAEVWATSTNSLKPVAFITGMTIAKQVDATHVTLPLKLSMKWLSKHNAQVPVTLRNVYVQDISTSVPLSTAAEITTTVAIKRGNNIFTSSNAIALMKLSLITNPLFRYVADEETMFYGKRPATLARTSNAGHKVLIVHGYCSEGTPFSTEDFPGAMVFLDKKANRDHDTFAQMIGEFGKDADSFSIIGHSQAGPASLQLLTFYWSKQDTSAIPAGKRLIQTVGSPWRGSGLAGSLASIGSIFGTGCGSNYDLTHEGSEQWLATIPASTRKFVYYHTTQFAKGGTCSFGANWVLESPNDGTTEVEYANLDGGNAVSHTVGQCHVTEMNYPPQCHDHTRNAEMFAAAQM